ncbi:MAG: hypothetical protein IPN53_01330 [Comamonadaceae bacterium]|nr:hypothetical protein [Comamonadaceae bacterium]
MIPKRSRSGGPRTPAGKQAISLNALKTGAYAKHVVLPGESAAEFEQLLASLQKDFNPRNLVEQALIADVANILWKKWRFESASHAMMVSKLVIPPSKEYWAQIFKAKDVPEGIEIYFDKGMALTPAQGLAITIIGKLLDEWLISKKSSSHFSSSSDAKWAPLHQYFAEHKAQTLARDGMADALGIGRYAFSQSQEDEICQAFAEIEVNALVWVWNRRDQIRAAMASIKATQLVEHLCDSNANRVTEDLNRALYRALAELRKLQSWHLDVHVQDITDVG